MKIEKLKKILDEFGDNVRYEYDLKKKNWFNIGGKSKVFYKANDLKELVNLLKKLNNKEKIFILGAGSNTLVNDNLFDGVVIKLSKNFNNISLLGEDIIIAGSAVLDKYLSDFAMKNNLSGLEFLSCIPGTVGGGIKMNAGCFGREFKDILISVQAVTKDGNIMIIPKSNINSSYRDNDLDKDLIFLSATFKGEIKDKKDIQQDIRILKEKKELTQPTKIKTGGSTFKNPIKQTDKKVWQLIKESVPLDVKFGDAQISKKHSNFFVNTKNASFEDMNNLVEFVKEKVKDKTGVLLETEIIIIE